MKVIVFLAGLSLAFAAPQDQRNRPLERDVQILRQDQEVNPDGSYRWSFETSNGITAQEQGFLKNAGQKDEAQVAQGQNKYTAPNGEVIETSYIADENGFQVQGSHLPVPPEIPPAIVRALKWILAHPEKDEPQRP